MTGDEGKITECDTPSESEWNVVGVVRDKTVRTE
jgi:hypothetical protein